MEVDHSTGCTAAAALLEKRPTSFLDLPPELRNYIYSLTLPQELHFTFGEENQWEEDKPIQPSITRTSRQCRTESLPMFYSTNKFSAVSICYEVES